MINYTVYWTPRKTKHHGKYSFTRKNTKKIVNELITFITESQTYNKCIPTRDNFGAWMKIRTGKEIKNTQDIFNSAYDAGIIDESGRCGQLKYYTLGPNAHHFMNDRLKVININDQPTQNDQVFVR